MERKKDSTFRIWSLWSVFAVCIGLTAVFGARALADAIPTTPTAAQQQSVVTDLGIFGGNTTDIAVDGDHVYTIANGVPNGFFYSSDAAVTWQRPAGNNDYGSGTAVEVDPSTHAVYVALDGLYKSTDFGATLTKLADNIGNPLLFSQGKIFATWNDSAYISSDNGVTFTHVTIATGENIMSYAASKTTGTFYAVTQNPTTSARKLFVSTDSGVTWSVMPVDSSVTPYTNINADPFDANILTLSDDNNLWLSINAGTTWTKMGVTPARSCSDFSAWTSTRWYACAGYSTNNGSTWTDMDMHTNVMRGPGNTVVINAADEQVLYGDCMSGVCKSTDGGLTWHNSLDGITGVNVLAISQTTNKSTVWIASSNGLGKTTNFTSATPTWTWPILPCDPNPLARCDSSGIGQSVWVKPDNANIVLAGSVGGWVYRSTDSGTTWTAQIPSVIDLAKFKTSTWNDLTPNHFINDPTDPNTVYLAMVDSVHHIGAVLKSTNAGVTWTDLAITDDAPAAVLSMAKSGALYAGTGEGKTTTTPKGVYKYENGSWTKLTGIDSRLNITSVMVDPQVQTTIYAAASNDLAPLQIDGFYKSTDSGANWTKIIPTGYVHFGTITVQQSTAPNTIYMSATDSANHGVLLKSSDVGATWGLLYTGLKSETFTTALFDGLVAGNKHGLFGIKSKVEYKSLASKKIKKGKTALISTTLRDKATKKVLKSKKVSLYKKVGKVWKFQSTHTTNAKGLVRWNVRPSKTGQYRLVWKPIKTDKAEYASATSSTVTITVKK